MKQIIRRWKWSIIIVVVIAALSVGRANVSRVAVTMGVTDPFAKHYESSIDYGISVHYSGQVWVFWRCQPINPEIEIHHHQCVYP